MSNYNYELNTLFNNNPYDELLEFNMKNLLNENIASLPLNKTKEMLKKITSIKNDKQMESFVKKHKKFVKPQKQLKKEVFKLARQLNFDDKEVKDADYSIVKGMAAAGQTVALTAILGIPGILKLQSIN